MKDNYKISKEALELLKPKPINYGISKEALKALTADPETELLCSMSNDINAIKKNTKSSIWMAILISVISSIISGLIVGTILHYIF